MNKPRLMLLAASVLLVIAGAVTLILFKQDANPSNPRNGSDAITAAVESPRGDGALADGSTQVRSKTVAASDDASIETKAPSATSLPEGLPPMPPADLPLSAQLEALAKRAKAGDPDAACRLLIQGERCGHYRRLQFFVQGTVDGRFKAPNSGAQEVMIDSAARWSEEAERDKALCDGIDINAVPDVDETMANALNRLTVRQKVILALVRGDGQLARIGIRGVDGPRRSSDAQGLPPQFYSDYLVDFLHEGLAARDPLALEGMVLLHVPMPPGANGNGLRVALPDQYRFALYARASLELNGPVGIGPYLPQFLDRVLDQMSAEKRQQLEREVSALVADFRAAQPVQRPAPTANDAGLAELCAD